MPALAEEVNPAEVATNDIIVTATRRAQSLQDTPVAVTAVSDLQVKSLRLTDTRDLSRIVPSLTFSQGSTTKLYNFTIRGVGSYVTSDAFDQSVGVAVDGISVARPGGSVADLVDIERVEVLEGPQGMLFGRNASAGLVNIITRAPVLGETSFTGRISYGSFDESQLSGTANIALGTTVAARLTGWRFRHDGHVNAPNLQRKIGEKDTGGIRAKLVWEPEEGVRANFTGEIFTADQDPSVLTIRTFVRNQSGVRDNEMAQGIVASPRNRTTSSDHILYNRQNSKALSADINFNLGPATLSSVTAFRRVRVEDKYDPGTTNARTHFADNADDIIYKQFSQELRISSDSSSRLRYVAGLIYYNLKIDDFFWVEQSGSVPIPIAVNIDTKLESDHYGAFGELTYDVVPNLRLIAGGRISHDTLRGSFNRTYRRPPVAIIPPLNGPNQGLFGPYSTSSSVKNTEPSYRFGLQYDATSDVMIYATASRGYKAAGLDFVFILTPAVFNVNRSRVNPEIADNLELGIRSQFFDRRLTINATAFIERFKDFQVAVRLPSDLALYSVENANEMKSTGVTAQIEARPVPGLSLSSSIAYIHARYTDFVNAPCYPGQPVAASGRGFCVGGVQNLNGKPLANSPRWRINLTARHEFKVGEYSAFAQVNHQYQSKQVFNAVADPFERHPGYGVTNLAAGFGSSDDRWQLSLYGSNIFDKSFIARTVPQLSGAYYSQVVPYEARARWGVALDVSF